MHSVTKTIALESLGSEVPAISEEAVGFYVQNCIICFGQANHQSGVLLKVVHRESKNSTFILLWSGELTDQLRRQYGDLSKATDAAACAIALLIVPEITAYTGIEQSIIGTTIDYYLAPKDQQDDTHIFNRAARLEVSGILRENPSNTVDKRVRAKIHRLKPDSSGDLPTFIFVVEFSQPWAKMVEQ